MSLILGAVPALRVFWTIAILFAVALTVYLVLLARAVSARSTFGRSAEANALAVPDPWVSAGVDRSLRDDEEIGPRLPWVRLLVEENSA